MKDITTEIKKQKHNQRENKINKESKREQIKKERDN